MTDTYIHEPETLGDQLLYEVFEHIHTYCVLPSEYHTLAVTLWVAHTHFLSQFDSTPRLSLQSPDKQSGKTRLMETITPMVHKAEPVMNMSPAAMYYAIEEDHPTFLVDEADTIFTPASKGVSESTEALRGIINAGHRRGQYVSRVNMAQRKREKYGVFSAVVLAGISKLPDTIEDRSIIIHMKRKLPDEDVAPYRQSRDDARGEALGARLAHWAASTPLPDLDEHEMHLTDRPADVWEPLYRIAKAAGGSWLSMLGKGVDMVRSEGRDANEDDKVILLRDIRTLRDKADARANGVHALQLVAALNNIADSPWQSMDNGRGINAYMVRKMLKEFAIHPVQVKVNNLNGRGYRWEQFTESIDRYLSKDNEHNGPRHYNFGQALAAIQAEDAGEAP